LKQLSSAEDLIDYALEITRKHGHSGSSKEKLVRLSHVLVDVLERGRRDLDRRQLKKTG
jgi:cation transport regulator ChaC